MKLGEFNPTIYSAAIHDHNGKSIARGERVSYAPKLIYVLSGEIGASVGEKKLGTLGTGTLLYIPAGARYSISGGYLRVAVISFGLSGEEFNLPSSASADEFNPKLSQKCPATFDMPIHIDELESVCEDVVKICELFITDERYSIAKAEAILKLLLIRIAEASDENALPIRMIDALDEYIRDHAGEEITNTEIGAIFGYHPFYVSTVIKEKRGMTLRQYIIAYRLRLAKNLLRYTTKTVAEIAEEAGFTDASYFTKTFRATFGETPKEWRAKFKEDYI